MSSGMHCDFLGVRPGRLVGLPLAKIPVRVISVHPAELLQISQQVLPFTARTKSATNRDSQCEILMKRLFDILIALLLVVPVSIVVAVCVVLIRLDSEGSPIFAQTRVGRGQRQFTLYKLRTMKLGTLSRGSHEVSSAQITRIGHVMRKVKLDELPQIWNVFVGQMSFVGPRPCLPNQTELMAEREKRGVFDVRPGVTGPAQLAGIDMSTPERLAQADADYVANRSFLGDLNLLVITATGKGRGDAVKPAGS